MKAPNFSFGYFAFQLVGKLHLVITHLFGRDGRARSNGRAFWRVSLSVAFEVGFFLLTRVLHRVAVRSRLL
jgi:hypothetical protein